MSARSQYGQYFRIAASYEVPVMPTDTTPRSRTSPPLRGTADRGFLPLVTFGIFAAFYNSMSGRGWPRPRAREHLGSAHAA